MNLPEYVNTVLNVLSNSGFEAYLVGGCVRDVLMGRTPFDYDVTTNALPEQILCCFAGYRTLTNGIKHGTVSVVFDKQCVEITTYRVDGNYFDNRHPENVTFTTRLSDDLSRRDFTVNAIAFRPESEFVDIFCGIDDIKRRILRCVGKPDLRFGEDALRILRCIRFSSVLDFDIEYETAASVHANAYLLKSISAERIYTELIKLLSGRRVGKVLCDYRDVMTVILPELSVVSDDAYSTMCRRIDLSDNNTVSRLCAMFSVFGVIDDSSRLVADALTRLKADTKTVRIVSRAVELSARVINCDEKYIRRFISDNGFELSRLSLNTAIIVSPEETVKYNHILRIADKLEKNGACLFLKQLNVNGNDILSLGVQDKSSVGRILKRLLNDVVDARLPNERAVLLAAANQYCLSEADNEK